MAMRRVGQRLNDAAHPNHLALAARPHADQLGAERRQPLDARVDLGDLGGG
jgi:hypothetical protein